MSPADFEATRSFLLNYSKLWVQTLSRRLGYAMDGAFYDRDDLVTELAAGCPKLTVEQVNAAVRRHLKTRRASGSRSSPRTPRRCARPLDRRQAHPDHLRHPGDPRGHPRRGQGDRRLPAQGREGQDRAGGSRCSRSSGSESHG